MTARDPVTQDEYLDRLVASAPPVGPLTRAALRTLLRPDGPATTACHGTPRVQCVSSAGERRRTRKAVTARAAA